MTDDKLREIEQTLQRIIGEAFINGDDSSLRVQGLCDRLGRIYDYAGGAVEACRALRAEIDKLPRKPVGWGQ